MQGDRSAPLRELWYYALPSDRLRPGKTLARLYLGEPILLGRGRDGRVFALRDICPHRGIPLSEGGFDGAELQCPFHGWRFDTSGTCISIPSMSAEAEFDCGRIRVKSYPVREVQGNVWIFFGDNPDTAPDIPVLPDVPDGRGPNLYLSMVMPCQIDEGVFGLMDPGHNTFVHVSRWWRKAGLLEEKEKAFGPSPFGFAMLPHRPSGNLLPYKLLGGAPTTQIIFRLPSCRMEHTRFGRHWYVTLSTVTPLGSGEIALNHTAYWSWPALNPFTPLLKWALWSFTKQDREILRIQSKGLKYDPLLMLIDDADTQAKWYHRVKNEYARACAEGRPFENPVQPRTLRFRS